MKQIACKIIFALFAVILLFLSCESVHFKSFHSTEYIEKVSQNDTFSKSNEPILIWIAPEEVLFKNDFSEDKPILIEENFWSIPLISLIYPVGILAPPSFLL